MELWRRVNSIALDQIVSVSICCVFALSFATPLQAAPVPTDPFEKIKIASLSNEPELEPADIQDVHHALESILQLSKQTPALVASKWIFDDEKVKTLFVKVGAIQDTTMAQIAELYAWRIESSYLAGDLRATEQAYQQLLRFRLDPSPENDSLRLWLAFHPKNDSEWYFAKGRVNELNPENVSIFSRLRLMRRGYYGSIFPYVFFGGLGLISLLYAGYRWNLRLKVPVIRVSEIKLPIREKKVRGYERIPSSPDEYSQLLEVFGLDDNATDSAVKKAYRKLIKDCHPDKLGPNPDPELVEKFQILKEMHDRILQIRSSFFGRPVKGE